MNALHDVAPDLARMGSCVWLAAGATGASQGVFRWPLRTQNLLKARILLNMASGELSERDGNHLADLIHQIS
jgi:hypothetical protein